VGPLSSLVAPQSDDRRGRSRDAGFIVVGALAKLTLAVAVIGTAGYDAISMTATHLQVQDQAQQAAALGYDALVAKKSQKAAYTAILRFADENGSEVVPGSFRVGKDRRVTVTLRGDARTLVSSHLPGIKDYVTATGTGSAGDPLR
jgi:hypothetical protein